ncbi:FAD-dependent oxidoreductase [Aldersonia sp. NBC_00410]|uniref:FAD-dependent oxidoreductase n=1 Tax=Aldersonia sp. NBC_00410 TaxID=2975954 RepID=UPI0022586150|nr:FAD-dependent oxidoreductase [Aldersonia sp. NBC_00410]MCX5045106.1 FAD-dependent oxidoreductase [Aldersonia sp. NBC_00410]
MTSLWLDRAPIAPQPALEPDSKFEYVVVGAGLTGLTTAVLLARAGAEVAVVEARRIGAVTTGNTTAKLSLLQGTQLSKLRKRHSAGVVRRYVEANREGLQWLLRYCDEHGVATERQAAVTYAQTPAATAQVRHEYEACREAGLDVEWVDELDVPFANHGAVRLAEQAQFDPMAVLAAMTTDALQRGVRIFENTRVTRLQGQTTGHEVFGERCLDTEHGPVRADTVVLATGTPILDRGGYFARLSPQRSYSISFDVPGDIPRDMYVSADEPTRSVRYTPGTNGDLLLVGGNGHTVGRAASTRAKVDDLVDWTQRHFPGARMTHRWSAQDYVPIDGLPHVGPLLPGYDRILVATGFSKWGMANAVAAGLAISGRVLGGKLPWAKDLESWAPRELAGLPTAAKVNAEVGVEMARGWLRAELRRDGEKPSEGEGFVARRGLRPVGVCTVDGTTTSVSAICPHLYGVLAWNDAEKSWDCPLHGSRFAHDGRVLEGPATRALEVVKTDR